MASNIRLREIKPWKLEAYQRLGSLSDFWIGCTLGLLVGGVFLSQDFIWQGISVFCFAVVWIALRYSVKKRDFGISVVFDMRNNKLELTYKKLFTTREHEVIELEHLQALHINSLKRMIYLQCQDGRRYETWILKDSKPTQQIQAWLELNGKHIDISIEETEIAHSHTPEKLLQTQPPLITSKDVKFNIKEDQFLIIKNPSLGGQIFALIILLLIIAIMRSTSHVGFDIFSVIMFLVFLIPLALVILLRPMIFIFDAPTKVLSRVFRTWIFSTSKAYTLDQPMTLLISPKKELVSLYFAEGQSVNLYPFLDTIAKYSYKDPYSKSQPRTKLYHSFQIKKSVVDDVEVLASWLKQQGLQVDIYLEDKNITTIID